jgi:hypothetical protein
VSCRVDPRRPAHGAGGGDWPSVLVGVVLVPDAVPCVLPAFVLEVVEPFEVVELELVPEFDVPVV